MKRVILVLMFVLSLTSVLAMEYSIVVETEEGNYVKLYAWTSGGGPIITMNKGDANSDGIFETTFFALHEDEIKLQVMILDSKDKKIKDHKFLNVKTDTGWVLDCLGSGNECSISEAEEIDEASITGNAVNNSSEGDLENEVVNGSESEDSSLEDKEVTKESLNFSMPSFFKGDTRIPIFIIVSVIVILLIMYFKMKSFREFITSLNYFSEEGELARLRRNIRNKDRLIERTHEKKDIQRKIKSAKIMLSEENKRLEEVVRKDLRDSRDNKL